HPVTGSPCGTNFFRVEGPGLPAGGVQTNLWSVLGKKVSICGNGVLDHGEQCDDGNTVAGDCCSPTCQFEPLGSPCTAATVCTNNACNGTAATTGDSCSGGKCMGFTRDAKLTLIAGENPSLAGFPAAGDARTDGTSVRVSLINMDPARFPAGCAGAAITVGGISGTATVT